MVDWFLKRIWITNEFQMTFNQGPLFLTLETKKCKKKGLPGPLRSLSTAQITVVWSIERESKWLEIKMTNFKIHYINWFDLFRFVVLRACFSPNYWTFDEQGRGRFKDKHIWQAFNLRDTMILWKSGRSRNFGHLLWAIRITCSRILNDSKLYHTKVWENLNIHLSNQKWFYCKIE